MADTGVTVIGAGVVGLAVAARLAADHELVLLERNPRHGLETSSRNSEVIHAGMYYPTGTLKARLCVEGNRRLYEVGERHGVPCRRITKLIVAVEADELPALEALHARGLANGVKLRMLGAAEAAALEPNVRAVAAIFSPDTGIVNAHALMDHYAQAARSAGAVLQYRSELVALERRGAEYRLTLRTPDGLESFTSERVVNAAGLESDTVAALAGIDVEAAGYRLHWCKGSYFSVAASRSGLVSRLIYPLPGHASLGVHAVLGLEGRLRFGPDVEYLDERVFDYAVSEEKRAAFGEAARRIVPAIRDEDLEPDMSGIRAKLQGAAGGFRDFVIRDEGDRGLPGLVSLVGIDSPGLTSAAAIADEVASLVAG